MYITIAHDSTVIFTLIRTTKNKHQHYSQPCAARLQAAEEARKNKYVLRLVLHRLPKEVKTKNSSLTSDIEMKKEKPQQKSLPLALQKGSSFPTAFDNAGGASYACQVGTHL